MENRKTKIAIRNLIRSFWKFDDNQTPVSTWHDREDLIYEIDKLDFTRPTLNNTGSGKRSLMNILENDYDLNSQFHGEAREMIFSFAVANYDEKLTLKEWLDKHYKDSRTASQPNNELLEYWKRRCELAEDMEAKSPCDPDITSEQIEAHNAYNQFIADNADLLSQYEQR